MRERERERERERGRRASVSFFFFCFDIVLPQDLWVFGGFFAYQARRQGE